MSNLVEIRGLNVRFTGERIARCILAEPAELVAAT